MGQLTITNTNHMIRIQPLNKLTRLLNPVIQHTGIATRTSRLIRQLPRKHRRGVTIPLHDRLDIRLIGTLHGITGIEIRLAGSAIRAHVRRHTTVVGPVVDEVDDEFDAVLFGRRDDVVEALETVGARVDSRFAVLVQLVPDCAGGGLRGDIVEAPHAEDLEARRLQVAHDEVDVRVVSEEADPVAVCSGEVAGFAIDGELEAGGAGEGGGGSTAAGARCRGGFRQSRGDVGQRQASQGEEGVGKLHCDRLIDFLWFVYDTQDMRVQVPL